jgi:hypothetical protein
MKDTFARPDRRVDDRRCATGYVLDDGGDFVAHEGTELDDMAGSGSFYTTVSDLCVYDRALAAHSLVSAATMREALTSGQTRDGERINYGFGWYLGNYKGMHFADHDGEWIGFYSYICRYLMQPFSIFLLSNNPKIDLVEIANVATRVFR